MFAISRFYCIYFSCIYRILVSVSGKFAQQKQFQMINNQNKPWRWRFSMNFWLHSAVYTVWWLKKSYFADIASHYKCIILIFINIQHRAINFLVSYQISVNWCPSNISSAFCHVRYNCKMWLVAISRPFCNKPDGCITKCFELVDSKLDRKWCGYYHQTFAQEYGEYYLGN